jgi:hypothetical protein
MLPDLRAERILLGENSDEPPLDEGVGGIMPPAVWKPAWPPLCTAKGDPPLPA